MKGLVYKSTGSWYTVRSESGAFYPCRIKGKFRIDGIKSTNPIAVGDRVEFSIETSDQETTGLIEKIEARVEGDAFYWDVNLRFPIPKNFGFGTHHLVK